jgi:SAM-dependent methyltransferase
MKPSSFAYNKRFHFGEVVSRGLKYLFAKPHQVFTNYFFDPWDMLKRWRGILHFIRNSVTYTRRNTSEAFHISFPNLYYRSYDRYALAGSVPMHYFLQDIWVARYVFSRRITHVVDIGSRLDGYIAHLLAFCRVTYVDVRPLNIEVDNLEFIGGNITSLPFDDSSVSCLSSLHVIEHIGLGRYGDPVDPEGHLKAATEIQRVLVPGGLLVLSTVLGQERLCFDAHRIFDPETVYSMFNGMTIETFCLIDDKGDKVIESATFEAAKACSYGCGIFVLKKPEV